MRSSLSVPAWWRSGSVRASRCLAPRAGRASTGVAGALRGRRTPRRPGTSFPLSGAVVVALLVSACGGGGGGGGGSGQGGGGGPPPADAVTFVGFSFRDGHGASTSVPPLEAPAANPPTLGAPLDLVVVFHFSGVPAGPFDFSTLPVYTTPAQAAPATLPPGHLPVLPAKGVWVLVGSTVEFRPFVPTAPITPVFNGKPEAVPGLLPGCLYTASVSTTPGGKLGNLVGPGGSVTFGTTSSPAAYYPPLGGSDPPQLLAADPPSGSVDFWPGVFSTSPPGSAVPSFPAGPASLLVSYDRPLLPTAENLLGRDLDGDGLPEPTFFLRSRATAILLAHEVPAGALAPGQPAFAALSALHEGRAPAADGGDVIVHADGSGTLAAPQPGLTVAPSALSCGRDPSLLFAVLPADGEPDRLTVVDHVAGDPSFARLAVHGDGQPAALSTGLYDIGALHAGADGRLLAYDRATRRLHELVVTLQRRRPSVSSPEPGPPQLLSVTAGPFVSAPLSPPGSPPDPDLLDLAETPSGTLLALARVGGAPVPSVLRLAPVDPDGDGVFDEADGTFSGARSDVLLELLDDYTALEVLSESTALALHADADRIDLLDLQTGLVLGTAVSGAAGFGLPVPAGTPPARALAVGHLQHELSVALTTNASAGAVVRLAPRGMLPFGAPVTLLQRRTLGSLAGVSELNTAEAPLSPWGARELLAVTTAEPLAGRDAPVDDVFREAFVDTLWQDDSPSPLGPLAAWAAPAPGGQVAGGLRAVGVGPVAELGDFRPLTPPGWDPALAWHRSTVGEADLEKTAPLFSLVLLDTDAQQFPLPEGATPGVTAPVLVQGGHFVFRDFIVPEGVRVVVRGSRPLTITATRRIEIHGLLDLSGTDGYSEHAFDSSYLPTAGGAGGPGAGRGGDGQPTLFDPKGPGTLDQYVTPETGERGWGPVVGPAGGVTFARVGGHGGLSTAGYDPAPNGLPRIPNTDNTEFHRPPGGGGGSFYQRGVRSHEGAGSYRVQSNSTWYPFSKCPSDHKILHALYGNEELRAQGFPAPPLQCVYLEGTQANPVRRQPGAEPGDSPFADGSPENDFIGLGGELPVPIGGQGGGGGGSRIDSLRHSTWANDVWGNPAPFGPPFYPALWLGNVSAAPAMFDSRGGGGGGGGGTVTLRSFGDLVVGRTGHIDASGGHGGGGEQLGNSSFAGGGGGGSGGAVLLQAGGRILVRGDAAHRSAGFIDVATNGAMYEGAAVDVSGGMGREARTLPQQATQAGAFSYEVTRSDGGQGGFGLIQLQSPHPPEIDEGAYLYAQVRAELKQGPWTGDLADQKDHPAFAALNPPPDGLRYVDMLHYRSFSPFQLGIVPVRDRWYVLNGSFPPLVASPTGDNGQGPVNEWPPGSGSFWFDTAMAAVPESGGQWVVREPQPEKLLRTYAGYDPVTFKENNNPASHPEFPNTPGTTYAGQVVPFCTDLVEPDGTPFKVQVGGQEIFDPRTTIDRLPVVPPERTPPPFSKLSAGTSRWLDFAGVALRARDALGRPPPFFAPFHGTYNAAFGPPPAGADGRVRTAGQVPLVNVFAHYVANAGVVDPGLHPGAGDEPYNDVKVDAPDPGVLLDDVVTDNAHVIVRFQGAYPVRAGSHVPDPATLSPWVADLRALTGYPLVRFQVVFDLGANAVQFPFGPESWRPRVDTLRLRMGY